MSKTVQERYHLALLEQESVLAWDLELGFVRLRNKWDTGRHFSTSSSVILPGHSASSPIKQERHGSRVPVKQYNRALVL